MPDLQVAWPMSGPFVTCVHVPVEGSHIGCVLGPAADEVHREHAAIGVTLEQIEVGASLALIEAVGAVALVVTAPLDQAAEAEIRPVKRRLRDFHAVFDARIDARRFRVAEPGVGAGEAKGREGVRAAHRIVGIDRVEREGVDATSGQGSERLVAKTDERLRIVPLPGAA